MMAKMTSETTTRQRIVEAALELIARQGYRGTTVGEIEAAAGLTPRAGGLYRHFASKEDVLAAAMRQRTEAIDRLLGALRDSVRHTPAGNLRLELATIARTTLREFDNERTLLRVVMKEGDRFPWLRREFFERFPRVGFGEMHDWLVATHALHGLAIDDPEALAAVVFGGLVHFHLMQTVFEQPPPEVDEERYVDAWVEATVGLLGARGIPETHDHEKEAVA